MGKRLAESKEIKYFEASTKESINIKEIMDYMIDSIIKDMGISLEHSESVDYASTRSRKCNSC